MTVDWLGHPVTVKVLEGRIAKQEGGHIKWEQDIVHHDINIGLRSDGVVVWRNVKKEML